MRGLYQFVDTDSRYGNTSLQKDISRMIEEFRRACFEAAPRPGSEADPLFERPRSV